MKILRCANRETVSCMVIPATLCATVNSICFPCPPEMMNITRHRSSNPTQLSFKSQTRQICSYFPVVSDLEKAQYHVATCLSRNDLMLSVI